ncbi:hypothetical protein HMPREF0742_02356 [Rothia aeria F0184]|uniref:Uncharacterized protein n=1 Tax=Rothia aeria F0184 TaxID=888019 RepID=U7V0I6_9MICC|nr:hypothetical protein HMPREF0742_02356 [Rothia aeria F0184]
MSAADARARREIWRLLLVPARAVGGMINNCVPASAGCGLYGA